MENATLHWVLISISLYVTMFILVPFKRILKLSPFGFYLGLLQAFVILYLGQSHFRLFQLVGDPILFGVPLLTSLCWFPPAIIFAYFFPLMDTPPKKAAYILLFALGTAFAQYTIVLMGLWENIRWNSFYTFVLALFTHSLMTGVLLYQRRKNRI